MAGLFSTPEEVMAAERAQRAQVARSPNPLAAGFFNLGDAAAGAVARGGFGMDTRSPQQKQATELQQVMKGIDFKNSDSIAAAAQTLNDMGMQPQAFKLLSMVKEKPWVPEDPWVDTIEVDNTDGTKTYKKLLMQKQKDGTTKVVADVTGKLGHQEPTVTKGEKSYKLSPKLAAEVQLTDDFKTTLTSKLMNNPIFKTAIPGMSTDDPEAFAPYASLYGDVANKLKQNFREQLTTQWANDEITDRQYQVLSNTPDVQFLDAAYKIFTEGGLKKNVNIGRGILGAGIDINTSEITTNPNALMKLVAEQREYEDLKAKSPQDIVIDNPNTMKGAFNPNKLPSNALRQNKEGLDAMTLVELLKTMTPDQVRDQISATNPMSDDAFASNERYWNVLSSKRPENHAFIAAYLSDTSGQARLSLLEEGVKERLEAGDRIGAANLHTIARYLDKFDTDVNVQKGKDDTYNESLDHLYNDLNLGA